MSATSSDGGGRLSPPDSVEALLHLLRLSLLVPPDQLESFLGSRSLPDQPAKAAQVLIDSGLINAYHAKHLLAGRHKGFLLGPYRLLGPIGRGGMGTVYLAEHTTLARRVALKVFPPDRTREQSSLKRFYREGRAAAALDHPNLVRVHDICQAGDIHFLVLEYVEGQTLEKMVKVRGPLPVEEAVSHVITAAIALHHAHERGVVHRDIKPGNLLWTGETIKVLDMGLALFFDSRRDDLTRKIDDKAVLGTADYIAPEQALCSRVDGRADIYSLGATLYTLLTGQPPFGGESSTSQKLLAHQLRDPVPVCKQRPEVPVGLADVLARMMAKKPEERFQTPAAVAAALAPFTSLVAVPGDSSQRLVPPTLPAPKPVRRRLPLLVATALLTGVMAGGGGWWLVAGDSRRNGSDEPGALATESNRPGGALAVSGGSPPRTTSPVIYQLDLTGLAPLRFIQTQKENQNQPSGLPTSWQGHVWDPMTRTAFTLGEVAGRSALGLANLEGKSGGMWWLDNLTLDEGRRFRLDLSYLTTGQGAGVVRVAADTRPATTLARLFPSHGSWRSLSTALPTSSPARCRLEFHNWATGADHQVHLAEVRVVDVGSKDDRTPCIWIDLAGHGPFRKTVRKQETLLEQGTPPGELALMSWNEDTVAEVRQETREGKPAIALTNREGPASTMLFWHIDNLQKGRAYELVVTSQSACERPTFVKFRQGQDRAEDIGKLGGTGQVWETTRIDLPEVNGEVGAIEFHPQGRGSAEAIWMRSIEVFEKLSGASK